MDARRVLLVDDERLARAQLRRMLAAHPELTVVGEAEDVDSAEKQVHALSPDVLFLDVQMPRASGFDLLARLPSPPRVVFVTAHDAHAVRAFEVNALDYLCKPISPERLAGAVARILASLPGSVPPVPPPDELRLLRYDDRLLVPLSRRPQLLRVAEIAALTSADDYAELHTRAGQSALLGQSLSTWEQRLPASHFFRIHRSALVNLDALASLEEKGSAYEARVEGRAEPLPVSRRCAEVLRQRFR
jgi:two-component system LytT family response regulator